MAMKIFLFSLICAFVLLPGGKIFAETTSISVPKPIGDFVESLKEINIDNVDKNISDNISLDGSVVTQKLSDMGVQGVWDAANGWMEETLGISLGQIIKAVGNLIMWFLELMIGLIKGGLSEMGA
jgi:hypothetical protein